MSVLIRIYGTLGSNNASVIQMLYEKIKVYGEVLIISFDSEFNDKMFRKCNPLSAYKKTIHEIKRKIIYFINKPGRKFIIYEVCNKIHDHTKIYGVKLPSSGWKYIYDYTPNLNTLNPEPDEWENYCKWTLSNALSCRSMSISETMKKHRLRCFTVFSKLPPDWPTDESVINLLENNFIETHTPEMLSKVVEVLAESVIS